MVKIVVYLRRIEQRELGIDGEAKARVRGAQRMLDGRRPLRTREDESQIAGTLGKRQQALVDLRRDLDVDDVRHAAGGVHTVDAAEQTAPRDGDHHHTRGLGFSTPRRSFAQCVAEEKFL